jgi:hypothetical protein
VPSLFVIPAVGAVVLLVMVIDSVSVHPLDLVTVTVYVPADVIEAPALLPNELLHEYVPPPVAVTLIEVCEHVNIVVPSLFVIPAVGVLIS